MLDAAADLRARARSSRARTAPSSSPGGTGPSPGTSSTSTPRRTRTRPFFRLEVKELVGRDADALRALWRVLGSSASAARTVSAVVAPEDPLDLLLPEQAWRVPTTTWRWMLRLVDPAAAIAARGWPDHVRGSRHLDLTDPTWPDPRRRRTSSSWRRRRAADPGRRRHRPDRRRCPGQLVHRLGVGHAPGPRRAGSTARATTTCRSSTPRPPGRPRGCAPSSDGPLVTRPALPTRLRTAGAGPPSSVGPRGGRAEAPGGTVGRGATGARVPGREGARDPGPLPAVGQRAAQRLQPVDRARPRRQLG